MFFGYFLLYFNSMKILKVYDKINRNTVQYNPSAGYLIVNEYAGENVARTIISTKLFKLKDEKRCYFSYMSFNSGVPVESLDITAKYLVYKKFNDKGLEVHSERIHLKDNKSFLISDKIYDEKNEFIEIENHKGNRTIKFKVKEEILNQFNK